MNTIRADAVQRLVGMSTARTLFTMDLNTLRDALRQQPFESFTIRLADGRSEVVKHPEFVAVGPRIVVVVRQDNSVLKIEPLLIVSLDQGSARRKGDNGSPKK